MIENVSDYLVSIAIGVRFRSNFSIEDNSGQIIDRILYSKNAFFNPRFFPRLDSIGRERILLNDETEDTLRINSSNIVLEIRDLLETRNFKDPSQVNEISEAFNTEIICGVMKEYKITRITRIGYIKKYIFNVNGLPQKFLDQTIGNTIEEVRDINLRFSKRLLVDEALAKKEINDYRNVIFNIIKTSDKDELFISVDYQRYYDPLLKSPISIKFDGFCQGVEFYNTKVFPTWLNDNYSADK